MITARNLTVALGGRWHGEYGVARCPSHADRTPSLAIRDGDVAPLLTCHAGCERRDIIGALIELGLWQNGTCERATTGEKTPIIPVPADAPPMSFRHPKYGAPSRVWPYHLTDGGLAGYVARFDFRKEDGTPTKDYLPITFCGMGDGSRAWRAKGIPKPRPLYRLPLLLARPDAPMLVVEGEPAADAAQRLFPDHVVTTPMHGSKSPAQTDWSPAKGRTLTIWPDRDRPGGDFARRVAKLAATAGAASIAIVNVPDEFPEGWDLADPLPVGWTAEALRALLDTAPCFTAPEPEASETPSFSLTEDGIALAFAERHKDDLRFCHHVGKWFLWTGSRWQREETKLGFNWARKVCRDLNARRNERLSKASTAAAVERFAQADRTFAVTSAIWDADPFLLGTPAGVVDLRTGILRPAERTDYITRQTAVAPDFSAERPLWARFLDQATLGDKGLQRFLQQVAGYCLTGDVREHALFFVYGPGGNGKSVFLNVLAGLMGDYATTAAMDTFSASVTDRHPTDLAMLQGARMVSASETEEGRAWAESRIKQMTGGDAIRARFMRCDFFEYRPQFKLVLVGNHKPVLRNVDEAARRRFNIIPFIHKPPEPDRQLEAKLRQEWPAILAWAIEGCLDWQQNGLVRPDVVADATDEYFAEQDLVRQWVEECCETGRRSLCDTSAALFESWSVYAKQCGEQPGTRSWFGDVLRRLGHEGVKHTPGNHAKRGFLGIALKPKDTSGQWQNRMEATDDEPVF